MNSCISIIRRVGPRVRRTIGRNRTSAKQHRISDCVVGKKEKMPVSGNIYIKIECSDVSIEVPTDDVVYKRTRKTASAEHPAAAAAAAACLLKLHPVDVSLCLYMSIVCLRCCSSVCV